MGLPSIPEYYRDHIDSSVDLVEESKQCCPFHKEDTPSFSYSAERKRWRCFGSCKVGGDVIDLHKVNYKLSTREEAKKSLEKLYGVTTNMSSPIIGATIVVDEHRIEFDTLYNRCLMNATSIDRWLDLDLAMSKFPVETIELESLLIKWGIMGDRSDL